MSLHIRVVIDARKTFDSGIGTYIRSVVPRVLEFIHPESARAIVSKSNCAMHYQRVLKHFLLSEISSKPLSLAEQWALRRSIESNEIFWATSLAHPLFWRRPFIATVHDVAQLALDRNAAGGALVKSASWFYFQSLRKSAGLLLFNSEFTRQQFREYVGVPVGREVVTPLGVESWWFNPPLEQVTTQNRRPYFICVGNVRPHKNLRTLFEAFSRIINFVPHDLVIVGQHEGFRTKDSDFSSSLSLLGDRVQFLGRVDDPTLLKWVSGADAMVFPSLYEGFGLPALEAMAAGCPVIASRAGALPEVCSSAATYFDPTSPDELASLLMRYAILTHENRAVLVSNGIARAKEFTWDRTAKLTAEAILEAAESLSIR